MTVGMAYEAAGRPAAVRRCRFGSALAVRVDFSFLRAKMVPLIASVLTIAAFAGGAAYADLYALKKADKTLEARRIAETTEYYGEAKPVEVILGENDKTVAASAAASPMPKLTSYDLLLDISNKLPPREKVTIDIDRLDIDDQHVTLEGLTKTPEEVDSIRDAPGQEGRLLQGRPARRHRHRGHRLERGEAVPLQHHRAVQLRIERCPRSPTAHVTSGSGSRRANAASSCSRSSRRRSPSRCGWASRSTTASTRWPRATTRPATRSRCSPTLRARGSAAPAAPIDDWVKGIPVEPLGLETYINKAAQKAGFTVKSTHPRANQSRNGFVTASISFDLEPHTLEEVKTFLAAIEDNKYVAVTKLAIRKSRSKPDSIETSLDVSTYAAEKKDDGGSAAPGSAGGSSAGKGG